ncbi:MAG: prepilin-type N-terminal cleavage/methylation domain-containing protein [Candidatus Magnetoovum sp. WYHC-5]|nr:prepilin-type N-terminal cleavage/methylation domain-containing protein [Candidatus Magnetoovum sp. WYHC-5]
MNKRGFTLIEVIVAISILAIGITALIQLFSGSLKSITNSEDYTHAVLIAGQTMNEVRTNDDLKEDAYNKDVEGKYSVDVFIEQVDSDEAESTLYDLYSITIKITWRNGIRQRSFSLSTLALKKKDTIAVVS